MLTVYQSYPFGLFCQHCDEPLIRMTDEQLKNYINSIENTCPECQGHFNAFTNITESIDENFFFDDVFSYVGAKTSAGLFTLKSGQSTIINFEDYGIPKGARIVSINYTPMSSSENLTIPLEVHGNMPPRLTPKESVTLWPANISGAEGETKCSIRLTWLEPGSLEDMSVLSLVNAFEEYSAGDLIASIVPANTSIEFDIMQTVKTILEDIASKANIKEYFQSGVSYVPVLKIMVPILAKLKGIPAMPEEMQASLVRLAALRNQIAHTGKPKNPLDRKEVAKCLAAVIIGKWYVNFLRNKQS